MKHGQVHFAADDVSHGYVRSTSCMGNQLLRQSLGKGRLRCHFTVHVIEVLDVGSGTDFLGHNAGVNATDLR